TTSFDNTARFWSAADGAPIGPPLVHQTRVLTLAFSPDGKTVATTSPDDGMLLWRVPMPVEGDRRKILLRVEVATSIELRGDGGTGVPDAAAWKERRQMRDAFGGPPTP